MTTQQVKQPLVTVLICLYNGARFVTEALDSVFAQSCQDLNVVVIDDGSSDGGADLIARRYDDERLSVIRRPHGGLNVTRAASLAYATAPFVAFLDQDDIWMPAKLERQIDAARSSNAALVFSDSLLIDEAGQTIGQWSRHHPFDAAQAVGADGHLELLRRGCFVCFSTTLVRTAAAIAAGGFDGRYRYAADYDLFLRMALAGTCTYVPETFSAFRRHPGQKSIANSGQYRAEREKVRKRELARLPERLPRKKIRTAWHMSAVRWRVHVSQRIWQRNDLIGRPVDELASARYWPAASRP